MQFDLDYTRCKVDFNIEDGGEKAQGWFECDLVSDDLITEVATSTHELKVLDKTIRAEITKYQYNNIEDFDFSRRDEMQFDWRFYFEGEVY